jgi:hypothetical protein
MFGTNLNGNDDLYFYKVTSTLGTEFISKIYITEILEDKYYNNFTDDRADL